MLTAAANRGARTHCSSPQQRSQRFCFKQSQTVNCLSCFLWFGFRHDNRDDDAVSSRIKRARVEPVLPQDVDQHKQWTCYGTSRAACPGDVDAEHCFRAKSWLLPILFFSKKVTVEEGDVMTVSTTELLGRGQMPEYHFDVTVESSRDKAASTKARGFG